MDYNKKSIFRNTLWTRIIFGEEAGVESCTMFHTYPGYGIPVGMHEGKNIKNLSGFLQDLSFLFTMKRARKKGPDLPVAPHPIPGLKGSAKKETPFGGSIS